MLLGMEEKVFIIHMRERTARGIWKTEHGRQKRPGHWVGGRKREVERKKRERKSSKWTRGGRRTKREGQRGQENLWPKDWAMQEREAGGNEA